MTILRANDVRKSFRGDMSLRKREVLHGVSFEAGPGEILGFLGPNGAGKTTTIKILLGLIRPDAGSVTIFDRPAGQGGAMGRVGYLPESPYFHPHLTLGEFLFFCGRLSGLGGRRLRRRIGEVVETVGLAGHEGKRLRSFSKGMTQRAGLAQAVLHDPDLVILDEPFSGLDPLGRVMVRDILVDLRRRGRTIFFSSHILPDMEALCDRTLIIRDGRVARTIGLGELDRLGEGQVEIVARGAAPERIEAVADYLVSSKTRGGEILIVVRSGAFVRTVVTHLYNGGAEVLRIANRHRSLEEVFLDEIGAAGGREGERAAAGIAAGTGATR